ncbi:MAG: tetratricopeptide repeat protein [bacterium]|nr:tetratricopeptide repeat protein [bacterium]
MSETGRGPLLTRAVRSALHLPWPVWVALMTFLFHSLIVVGFHFPAVFRKYNLAAEQYLSGELPAGRLMDFSPFYFHLSLAAERLVARPEAVLHGLQIVLIAISAGFLFALVRRRFSAPLAAVAVVTLAIDRHVVVYERFLEPEACLLFFLLGFLFFVEREGSRSPWIAGGFAALCLATRPTFLPVFLLVPLVFRLRGVRGRRLLVRATAFALPVAAMLLVLMLRAAAITGDPRTPVMNPGTVLFEGNNPLSRGTSAIYPPTVLSIMGHAHSVPDSGHEVYRLVARAATGEDLSIAEVNAYWSERALSFIRAEPSRTLRLVLAKLVRSFHNFRWHDISLAWRYDQMIFIPPVPFALVSALALLGALFEVRRWRTSLLYYALGFTQLAVMLVFYVSARQRLVLLPPLIYFAAVAVDEMRRRGWRRSLPLQGLVVLLAITLMLPNDLIRDERYRRRGFLETERLVEEIRGKTRDEPLARHAELAVEAMAAAPWWLDWMRPAYFPQEDATLEQRVAEAMAARRSAGGYRAWVPVDFDLGVLLLRAGRLEEAERLLEPLVEGRREVYRGAKQPSEPLFYLGRAVALGGDRERAVELLRGALERSPGNPFVLAELIALSDDPRYQKALLGFGSSLDAQYLLGQALLVHDRPREAAAAFGFVVRRLPEFREGRIHLAAALGANGRIDEGAEHYLEAVRELQEPILLSRHIAELFRRWAALHPDRPLTQLFAARVLHQHGRFREALELLVKLDPPEHLRAKVAEESERIRAAIAASAY